ncbi:DNA endonuclease activator Ctp1 C-terminal domain-containing protein [Pseudoscourfieldia marina]
MVSTRSGDAHQAWMDDLESFTQAWDAAMVEHAVALKAAPPPPMPVAKKAAAKKPAAATKRGGDSPSPSAKPAAKKRAAKAAAVVEVDDSDEEEEDDDCMVVSPPPPRAAAPKRAAKKAVVVEESDDDDFDDDSEEEDGDVSQKKMPRLQDTSRHRARYEAPTDPPGFWDLDPPGFELRPDAPAENKRSPPRTAEQVSGLSLWPKRRRTSPPQWPPKAAGGGSSPPRAARPALAGGGSSPPRAARPALAPTKFNTVVRGKARAALPAFECAACSKFYAVAGLDMATYCKCDVSQKKMPRLQDTSRHRARYEAPADPPGFWDLDPKGFELRPDDWPELKAPDA